MPTVAENLLALDAVKDEIKAKIGTNLGRTIGAAVPFTDYADYILPPATYMPDPLWPSLSNIADGQIGMIVRDRDDLGVAARCAFTITATANYVVDWGDGTTDTIASGTMADHTYTLGAGMADSKGTTTFKVKISSTGTITRIQMAGKLATGNVKQTVQSVEIKARGITTMESAYQFCTILQRVGDMNLPLCTTFASAFYYDVELRSVGTMTLTKCASLAGTFQLCSSLLSVGDINAPLCTSAASAFSSDYSLRSIGAITLPICTSMAFFLSGCMLLGTIIDTTQIGLSATSVNGTDAFYRIPYSGVINTPNAKYTSISVRGEPDRFSGVTGLTFHASSTFSGTAPQINVSYTMMARQALVDIFNALPTMAKTINITGAIGAADLTAGDRAIATGKGWTITG